MKKCKNCGKVFDDEFNFCPNCGTFTDDVIGTTKEEQGLIGRGYALDSVRGEKVEPKENTVPIPDKKEKAVKLYVELGKKDNGFFFEIGCLCKNRKDEKKSNDSPKRSSQAIVRRRLFIKIISVISVVVLVLVFAKIFVFSGKANEQQTQTAEQQSAEQQPVAAEQQPEEPKQVAQTAEPKKETPKAEPKQETQTAEPKKETQTAGSNRVAPKKAEPKKETPKAEPKQETQTAEPKKETQTAEPKKETPKAEPKKETQTAEPKKETPKAEPKKETPKAEPKKGTQTAGSKKEAPAKTPEKEAPAKTSEKDPDKVAGNEADSKKEIKYEKIGQLYWSERSEKRMKFPEAEKYCKYLDPNDKWRLPTIDELRTVIKGCPKTESKGKCKINDWNTYDCSCSAGSNYSKFSDKENKQLWSRTKNTKGSCWLVDFGTGSISDLIKSFSNDAYVRCVKKNNK